MTSLTRNNYIAFHNGHLLPDLTVEWIVGSALRGKMTPGNELKNASVRVSS